VTQTLEPQTAQAPLAKRAAYAGGLKGLLEAQRDSIAQRCRSTSRPSG
jgi:hypothetical protein